MKRAAVIEGMFNIEQLAQFLVACGALATCGERTAWKFVDKFTTVIPRQRRGGRVFFRTQDAVTLGGGIKAGRYVL